MFDKNFVIEEAARLLSRYAKVRGTLRPPINPEELAGFCAVLGIQRRPMIPEGVLEPVPDGFKVHLQSNFAYRHGRKSRNRFTVAHELVHTFFYERNGGVPKPMRGSPKGQRLERLCHIGASQILVPDLLLKWEVNHSGEVAAAETISKLAKMFEVSLEVMMRRLQELQLIADANFAAILVDAVEGGRRLIRAACYGPILLSQVVAPRRGLDFDSWVRQLQPPSVRPQDTEWTFTTRTASIIAKKVPCSSRSFLLDLKFGSPC